MMLRHITKFHILISLGILGFFVFAIQSLINTINDREGQPVYRTGNSYSLDFSFFPFLMLWTLETWWGWVPLRPLICEREEQHRETKTASTGSKSSKDSPIVLSRFYDHGSKHNSPHGSEISIREGMISSRPIGTNLPTMPEDAPPFVLEMVDLGNFNDNPLHSSGSSSLDSSRTNLVPSSSPDESHMPQIEEVGIMVVNQEATFISIAQKKEEIEISPSRPASALSGSDEDLP